MGRRAPSGSRTICLTISYRRPILAGETETVSEIVELETCVETFPQGNIGALRAKVLALLEDAHQRAELVLAADRYAQRASAERRVERFVDIYSEILGHPPTGAPALLVDGVAQAPEPSTIG